MPNKARIKLWVDALRSGKWTQAIAELKGYRDPGCGDVRRCALGVAIEVALANGWQPDEGMDPWNGTVLPVSCAEWYGIFPNPRVDRDNTEISYLNDSSCPFTAIADAIEETYLAEAVPA